LSTRWSNQGKAAIKLIDLVPHNSKVFAPLIAALRLYGGNIPQEYLNRCETVTQTVAEPFRNQEQEAGTGNRRYRACAA